MKRFLFASVPVFVLVLPAPASSAVASTSPVFDELMKPYDHIRLALIDDSLDGVADEAQAIHLAAKENVAGGEAPEVRELLPAIAEHAEELADSTELADARAAFYELSKVLVRYRARVGGERPVVVYCSMAKKSWLQPAGEIGNPYHGPSMESCGEVVDE